MGNKTRKVHNLKGKKNKQAKTGTPVPAAGLQFPFHELDQFTVFLGVSGGESWYQQVIDAVPPEFHDYHNQWVQMAGRIFGMGANLRRWRFRNPELKDGQIRFLKAWLGSWTPQHEVKEAVCGWLLSLMLYEPVKE